MGALFFPLSLVVLSTDINDAYEHREQSGRNQRRWWALVHE